jgi:hypothetical protein
MPFIGTIVGGILLVMLHDDKELESLGTEDNYGDTIFFIVLFSLTICVLSATIFLSQFKQATENTIIHALSWMLLPLSCTTFMLISQINFLMEYLFDGWEHPPYEREMQLLFVFVCIGHIVAIVLSFFQYRKSLTAPATPIQAPAPKKKQEQKEQIPPITQHKSSLTAKGFN